MKILGPRWVQFMKENNPKKSRDTATLTWPVGLGAGINTQPIEEEENLGIIGQSKKLFACFAVYNPPSQLKKGRKSG